MVESDSLENCSPGNGTVGSNPTLSAKIMRPVRMYRAIVFFAWRGWDSKASEGTRPAERVEQAGSREVLARRSQNELLTEIPTPLRIFR